MEFKNRSRTFVSSTEISAVFCLNKHKTRNQLFAEKRFGKRDEFDCEATRHGRFWEPYALRKMADFFGDTWEFLKPGTLKDPKEPVCCAPDLVISSKEHDILVGVEVKCPWSAPIPKNKGEVPPEYLFQAFACLMISGADCWLLGFYDSDTDRVSVFEIAPDWSLWNGTVLPLVREFLGMVSDSSVPDQPFKRKGRAEKAISEKVRRNLLSLTRERPDLLS
jgi:hypothetical protein